MNEAVHLDAFNLLCGRIIGYGMTRQVFECNVDKKYVVKVEVGEPRTHFQNIMEWMVWRRVSGTNMEKWFAPVHEMSPDGRVLLMHRTMLAGLSDMPKKMPAFFSDFKMANYGMYKGHLVCHDYGSHLLMERGMTKAVVGVNWRELQNQSTT
jgi:hypothetical protein